MEKHPVNKFLNSIYLHPHKYIISFVLAAGVFQGLYYEYDGFDLFDFVLGMIIGFMLAYPIAMLLIQTIYLIFEIKGIKGRFSRLFDAQALVFGVILEYIFLWNEREMTTKDWQEQLINGETHTPIYSGAWLTVAAIFIVAIIGYVILNYFSLEKLPPLVAVLSMSAGYLGVIQVIVFTAQTIEIDNLEYDFLELYLLILPMCCVLIAARTVLSKVHEWRSISMEKSKIQENAVLNKLDAILNNSLYWPVLALVLALPLLGVLIGILVLFGQAPDSVVKAWTETSDWRLSQKISPQNIRTGDHYLCTVAAGGHRKVVKPIRKGVRRNQEIVVNRQLCVANAFEQVIEEYTPHFHKAIRAFYDRYGFPVAKLIKKPWIADIVYFIMKPLEWLFIIVLYLVDVHPENRIAVQYMGRVPAYRH